MPRVILAPYQQRAREIIDRLDPRRARFAAEFLQFLDAMESWEATREILKDKRTMRQIERSRRAWQEGRMEEFVEWKPRRRQKRT